jgi:hypothetical protein
LEFLQNPARPFRHGGQGVVGDVNRQSRFLGDEAVNAAQ